MPEYHVYLEANASRELVVSAETPERALGLARQARGFGEDPEVEGLFPDESLRETDYSISDWSVVSVATPDTEGRMTYHYSVYDEEMK